MPFWAKKLTDIPQVSHQIDCRWEELRSGPLRTDSLLQFIDDNVALLEDAQVRNFNRWQILGQYVWPNDYVGQSYEEEVDFLKNWLTARLEWMDNNMIGNCALYDPVSTDNLNLDVQLYPNPASDFLNVYCKEASSGSGVQFGLYDMLGRLLLSEELKEEESSFSTAQFPPGMYTFKISKRKQYEQLGRLIIH